MQQQHSGQHLVGQKQYELTNHLGNVQVTVSDLPYKHENDTMTHISPALKAVYDYYPFGSPMPGRTIMDTARKCMDMTRLDRVWKAWEMTQTEIYALSLINYHLDGEGKVFIDDNGTVEVEIADEYAVFYMDLQDSLNNGGEMVLYVDWLKEFSEKGFLLTLQGMDATGEMRVFYQKHYEKPEDAVYLNIADSFANVSVGIQGALHFGISNIRYFGGSWVNEEVLVRVCDDGGDRYRFGFNGQEKVNEIAGMGNHNTAEFWEYDTRLGRRWNVDPVDQIRISNYAVNGNNPVFYIDPYGDEIGSYRVKEKAGKDLMSTPGTYEVASGKKYKNAIVNHIYDKKDQLVGYNIYDAENNEQGDGSPILQMDRKDWTEFQRNYDTYMNHGRVLANASEGEITALSGLTNWDFGQMAKGAVKMNKEQWSDPLFIAQFFSMSYNGGAIKKVAAKGGSSVFSYITPKITKQMASRGWTKELIHNTVNNPFTTRAATNRATGNAATAYFQKNGSYVVKDNVTNQVIQISNRLDPKWIPDATIINPYIPK